MTAEQRIIRFKNGLRLLNLLVDERKPWYSREVAESVEAKRLIASQDEIIEYIRATYPSEADSAKTWKNPLAARS